MLVMWGPGPQHVLQTVVHVDDRFMNVVVLYPTDDRSKYDELLQSTEIQKWSYERLISYARERSTNHYFLSGRPDHNHVGTIVSGLPEDGGGRGSTLFGIRGKITLDLDGLIGKDEWVDHSLFDVYCKGDPYGEPTCLLNRYIFTGNTKAQHSYRLHAMNNDIYMALVSIFVPFATQSIRDVPVIGVRYGRYAPISTDGSEWEHRRLGTPTPEDARGRPMYTAVAADNLEVKADGTIEVPLQLTWNRHFDLGIDTETPCRHTLELKAESDGGYMPTKRVFFDGDGRATVRIVAMGNRPGDKIKVKLNATHYSGVGNFIVNVV